MAILVIQTPRTNSANTAILVPPGQSRNFKSLRALMKAAERELGTPEGNSDDAFPFQLAESIGVARMVPNAKDQLTPEIYLLDGVDCKSLSPEMIREIQTRLASQTIGLVDRVISEIPWNNRKDPGVSQQFSGEFVTREELTSLSMMFPRLPEPAPAGKAAKAAGSGGKGFNPFHWAFLIPLFLVGGALYYVQNELPPKFLSVSKAIGFVPVMLGPFLWASRYFIPIVVALTNSAYWSSKGQVTFWQDFKKRYGLLTALYMAAFFIYNLLASSVPLVAIGSAFVSMIAVAITLLLIAFIFSTSIESNLVRIAKYILAGMVVFVGLTLVWSLPVVVRLAYLGGSSVLSGGGGPPPRIEGLPELPSQMDPQNANNVGRNLIKLKGAEPFDGGAVCFVRSPISGKTYAVTSQRVIDNRMSNTLDCSPKDLPTRLESWKTKLFSKDALTSEMDGLAGTAEDYQGSELLLLTLKEGQKPSGHVFEISPMAPDLGEMVSIFTPFGSMMSASQDVVEASVTIYARGGNRMVLSFFSGKNDVTHFEGSPVLDLTGNLAGIVLGPSPATQRPFDTEASEIEVATNQALYSLLKKVEHSSGGNVLAAGQTSAAPQTKPIVLPDPFAKATIDQLQKELPAMRKSRAEIAEKMKAPPAGLVGEMEIASLVARFNRRRQFFIAACNRLKAEFGQGVLDPLSYQKPANADLSPEVVREQLTLIRELLGQKRTQINPADPMQVEQFYFESEWFNNELKAFNAGAAKPDPGN